MDQATLVALTTAVAERLTNNLWQVTNMPKSVEVCLKMLICLQYNVGKWVDKEPSKSQQYLAVSQHAFSQQDLTWSCRSVLVSSSHRTVDAGVAVATQLLRLIQLNPGQSP